MFLFLDKREKTSSSGMEPLVEASESETGSISPEKRLVGDRSSSQGPRVRGQSMVEPVIQEESTPPPGLQENSADPVAKVRNDFCLIQLSYLYL